MYAQYQYYQHQQNNHAPVSTQQQSSNNMMDWNGSAWVPKAAPATTSHSMYSTYQQPQHHQQQHHQQQQHQQHQTYQYQQQQQHHQQHRTYQQQPQQQQQQTTNSSNSNSNKDENKNPVTKYTEYYHAWLAHQKEYEVYIQKLPIGSTERGEAQRRIDWAKYYADLSSRAAHYFYENPTATTAPMELPPAPTTAVNPNSTTTTATATTTTVSSNVTPASLVRTVTPASGTTGAHVNNNNNNRNHYNAVSLHRKQRHNDVHKKTTSNNTPERHASSTAGNKSADGNGGAANDATPGGLKRYVQNCLKQASSKEEERLMQREVEQVIAKAIQDGNLHSKNWDAQPLIRLPNAAVNSTNSENHQHCPATADEWKQQQLASFKPINLGKKMEKHHKKDTRKNNNKQSKMRKNYDRNLPSNDSYYGPAGGSESKTNRNMGMNNINNSAEDRHNGGATDSNQGVGAEESYYGPSSFQHSGPDRKKISNQTESYFDRKSPSSQNNTYYGPAIVQDSSSYSQSSLSPSSAHSNTSSSEDFSFSHQQKKRKKMSKVLDTASEEDFIPLNKHQAQKNKKAKMSKASSKKGKSGFERSSAALAKRASRFSGPGGIENISMSTAATKVSGSDRYMGKGMIGGSHKKLDEVDYELMTVKGTCKQLEKEYLRLTAPPRAELVRPQPILERHLENLKVERATGKKGHDYLWFCSQLKAVRQDCTVQRIQNGFTVDVYETHAKMALEEDDMNEYNQCQTQLKELYEKLCMDSSAMQNHNEFVAYRLLYYIMLSSNKTYSGGFSDLLDIMLSLSAEQRKHPAITHACEVREAVSLGEYYKFFCLHEKTPNLGGHLTSRIADTMRFRALQRIAKAYRPSIDLTFCLKQLGFGASSSEQQEKGKFWLKSCGCVLEGNTFMTKDSNVHEPDVEVANSLI